MPIPTVSVCIPARNAAAFLATAVDSVLAQTRPDFELVVCDNASTDGTEALMARYGDQRIRYRRFPEFVSQAANWNRCLESASARYVVVLHADDALEPGYLGRALSLVESDHEIVLVHCAVRLIDQEGRSAGVQQLHETDRVVPPRAAFERLLIDGCVISPAGVLVRRDAMRRAGPFREQIVWGVDWNMWMRLAIQGGFGYLAEPLARYRQHAASGTAAVIAEGRSARDEIWAMDDALAQMPAAWSDVRALRPRAVAAVAHRTWCLAEEACRAGYGGSARRGLFAAARMNPRLAIAPKSIALFVATYAGYPAFQRLRRWRQPL